jgi:hypothetical protein
MADAATNDKRLLLRSMAQRHRSARAAAPAPETVPDLAERVRAPEPGELETLAKDLEVERTARAERIRRALEQRAAGPVVAPRAIPVPFDENDL